MINAVGSGSSGWAGGAYVPSGRPTNVGGGGFPTPGAGAATPPGVPSSGIIEARNNRGSNIRIPYARLVPLHSRDHVAAIGNSQPNDKRVILVDGKPALEYDGLRNGELAWILGRRFKTAGAGGGAGVLNTDDPNRTGTGGGGPTGLDELNDSQRYAHQAYAGLGNGVDRMQRLASTDWIESLIMHKLGTSTVNLHAINLTSAYATAMDSNLRAYAPYLAGSTAIHTQDVTACMAAATGAAPPANLGNPKHQGVFVLELGPFLRGTQVSSDAVPIREILGTSASQDTARNLGDTLAFSAIDAELRRRNLLDWTPDGVVLSKLESPTDEPAKSIEMDARSAQLFNVAIQGPAISTSWTSDVRDYKLECQPMDRVFVCLVADLAWTTDAGVKGQVDAAKAARDDVDEAIANLDALKRNRSTPATLDDLEAAKDTVKTKIQEATAAADDLATAATNSGPAPYETKLKELSDARTAKQADEANPTRADNYPDLVKAFDDAQKKVDDLLDNWPTAQAAIETAMAEVAEKQNRIRTGEDTVARAVLTNFRLMRSTSSHMVNYSNFKPGNKVYRCGLRLGKPEADSGVGEYIVGAWCIGTVIDSAASRSTVGTLVRTAPTSMALNINVNIEWWSGDKLYKHYMDDSGLTQMRGQPSPMTASGTKRTRFRAARGWHIPQAAFVIARPVMAGVG